MKSPTLKKMPLSFWRMREEMELTTRNTHLKVVSRRMANFFLFATFTMLFAVTFLVSLLTLFRDFGLNGWLLTSGAFDFFVFVGILRQYVILSSRQVVSGNILWKWLFSEAIAIEYTLIDSVKLTRNFSRPCLEISSSGAEVTIKLVRGWRVERLVPVLKVLNKHGVRWAFDEQCQRLVEGSSIR